MPADISFFGCFCRFFCLFPGFCQISFTLRLCLLDFRIFVSLILLVHFLIHFLWGKPDTMGSHFGHKAEKSAMCTFHFVRILGFGFIHLLIRFCGFVYQTLYIGLMKQYLYIVLALLDKGIIPLGKCFIIPERFPILAVQFLHLSLFLFLAAGEVLYFIDN